MGGVLDGGVVGAVAGCGCIAALVDLDVILSQLVVSTISSNRIPRPRQLLLQITLPFLAQEIITRHLFGVFIKILRNRTQQLLFLGKAVTATSSHFGRYTCEIFSIIL